MKKTLATIGCVAALAALSSPLATTDYVNRKAAEARTNAVASAKAYTEGYATTNYVCAIVTNNVGGISDWTTGGAKAGENYVVSHVETAWRDGEWKMHLVGTVDGMAYDSWRQTHNADAGATNVSDDVYGIISERIVAPVKNALGLAYDRDLPTDYAVVSNRAFTSIPMPLDTVTAGMVLTKTTNGVAWAAPSGGAVGTLAQIQDVDGKWHNVRAETNALGQVVISVDGSEAEHEDLSILEEQVRAEAREHAIEYIATNEAARAVAAEAAITEQLGQISSLGRFLSTWNAATGRPGTEPKTDVLKYLAGDYYIVGSVAETGADNYAPTGSAYTNGAASTALATDAVNVNDIYRYSSDGSWIHVAMAAVETDFAQIAGEPTNNVKLAAALDARRLVTDRINWGDVTNAPAFVTETVTNGLASEAYANAAIIAATNAPVTRLQRADGSAWQTYDGQYWEADIVDTFAFTYEGVNYRIWPQSGSDGVWSSDDSPVGLRYADGTWYGIVSTGGRLGSLGSVAGAETGTSVTISSVVFSRESAAVSPRFVKQVAYTEALSVTNDYRRVDAKINWADVTNAPAYVTETVTNGLASEAWVGAQGYVTETVTNGLASTAWVGAQGYVTETITNNVASSVPTMQQIYDLIYPVGAMHIGFAAPTVPTGVTATWAADTTYNGAALWVDSTQVGTSLAGSLPNISGYFQVTSTAPAGLMQSQSSQFERSGPFTAITRSNRTYFNESSAKLTMVCGVNFNASSANSIYGASAGANVVRPTSKCVAVWERTK